jgi:hypothetical protein
VKKGEKRDGRPHEASSADDLPHLPHQDQSAKDEGSGGELSSTSAAGVKRRRPSESLQEGTEVDESADEKASVTSNFSKAATVARFVKPAAPVTGPRISNINSLLARSSRKHEDEARELRRVSSQSSDQSHHSDVEGIFRESTGSNNSQIGVLLNATMSPQEATLASAGSGFSPHLGDIRSPTIKLAPLDHNLPVRKPHRKRISTLHERSKQSSSSSSSSSAHQFTGPLDPAARRLAVERALSQKPDLVEIREEKGDDDDAAAPVKGPSMPRLDEGHG